MKKLFLSFVAIAAMVFASSCQQEKMEPAAGENTVTFTVELPNEMATKTKAMGDGENVDELIYEVWRTDADGRARPYRCAVSLQRRGCWTSSRRSQTLLPPRFLSVLS